MAWLVWPLALAFCHFFVQMSEPCLHPPLDCTLGSFFISAVFFSVSPHFIPCHSIGKRVDSSSLKAVSERSRSSPGSAVFCKFQCISTSQLCLAWCVDILLLQSLFWIGKSNKTFLNFRNSVFLDALVMSPYSKMSLDQICCDGSR